MTEDELLAALDCCREGGPELDHDELAPLVARLRDDPQWSELLRRGRQCDGLLGAALHDLPIPEGLEERLLDRLRAAIPTPAPAAKVERRTTWTRRALVGGLATIAAGLLVAWLGGLLQSPAELTFAALREETNTWFDAARRTENWQVLPAPADFAISPKIRWQPRGWTALPGKYRGVAFDLSPGNPRAGNQGAGQQDSVGQQNIDNPREAVYLFVLRTPVAGLPPAPPREPFSTGGRSVGEWEADGSVYVLAVEGGPDRYRRAVDTAPPAALAQAGVPLRG